MRCLRCNEENPASGVFCIFCGSPIRGDTSQEERQPQEETTGASTEYEHGAALQEQVRSLENEMHQVMQVLLRVEDRVSALEQLQGLPAAMEPARAEKALLKISQVLGGQAEALPTVEPTRAEAPPTVSPSPPTPPLPKRRPAVDWEQVLSGNWLARIGVLALIIGVGFFLKLAFENNWIGETGRVVLGIIGGVALLGVGEYWRKRYPVWAQALTGGGIAILYLSIFAAFALYHLVSFFPAFGFMFLITLAAVGLALRYEAKAIAILGIIGAFVTPIILDVTASPTTVGGPNPNLVLAYVLLLDAGVLGLATLRNWRWFTLLGLLGSLTLFGLWYGEFGGQASLLLAQGTLTLIFLIFVGATTLFHILWRRTPGPADLGLMVLNAAAYFGISYGLLWDGFRVWLGGFSLLLALFYGLLGYAALARSRENAQLTFFTVGIALVFLTIAVPVQLGGAWITVAWAAEGVVLMWLSLLLRIYPLRLFSLGVFAIVVIRLMFFDIPRSLATFQYDRFLAFMVAIAAMYLAAYLLWRGRTVIRRGERWLFPTFLVAANLFLTIAIPVHLGGAWVTVAWAAEGAVLLWLSFLLGIYSFRLFSLGVFAMVVIRLMFFDTPVNLATFQLILNDRFLAFVVGIAAMYLAAYLLWRGRTLIRQGERWLFPTFLVAANFFSLWVLSAEAISYFGSRILEAGGENIRNLENARSLSLTLLWALYALALIVVGIMKRWRWVRLGGLALLCVPIGKVFVFDVFTLEQGYRIAAFLSLGVILVTGGFLYHRYSKVIRRFLLG